MERPIIDAHIHVDLYEADECVQLLQDLEGYNVEALIAVSRRLSSTKKTLELAREYREIKPAFGFHPEQPLPKEEEIIEIQHFMDQHHTEMVAVGEVGLPYYARREDKRIAIEPYLELLELFIKQAVSFKKPVVLHAIYEDAPIVCTLLEKYGIQKAHFHWFKGDKRTVERMKHNEYFISITPDVLYEREIQQLVKNYPLSQMMVETDGPWSFDGPFKGKLTHPKMIHQTIGKIADIKRLDLAEVYEVLYENTKQFYQL